MNKNLSQSNDALQNIQNFSQNEIILYRPDDAISLEVRLENETVWLTQEQIALLFGVKRPAITKHVRNIFESEELEEKSVCSILERTASDGKHYMTQFYNLDMILSVGYRVNSKNAVMFRRWASSVLKDHLLRGYSLNYRLSNIEEQLKQHNMMLDAHQKQIDFFVRTSLPPKERLFFDGQLFDAHILMSQLVESAEKRIVLIDNYIDESVLTLLLKRKRNVEATVYTMQMSSSFKLDLQKHNAQYPPIAVNIYTKAHDRFLIIDDKVYHVGASVKDLGKKLCAVSLLSCIDADEMIHKL